MKFVSICSLLHLLFGAAVLAQPTSIVGDWILRNEQMEVRVSLRADGSFERITAAGGQVETVRGKYRLEADAVQIIPEGGDETIRMNVRTPDGNTLELTDDNGAGVRMVRVGPPAVAAQSEGSAAGWHD